MIDSKSGSTVGTVAIPAPKAGVAGPVASDVKLSADGKFAYVAAGTAMAVIDVSEPKTPKVLSNVAASGVRRVSVDGDLAVFVGDQGLTVLDGRTGAVLKRLS